MVWQLLFPSKQNSFEQKPVLQPEAKTLKPSNHQTIKPSNHQTISFRIHHTNQANHSQA